MKKSELQTGMWVKLRKGSLGMVLLNTKNGDIISGQTWMPLKNFNDDLISDSRSDYDVIEVYQPEHNCNYIEEYKEDIYMLTDKKLIWIRDDKSDIEIQLESIISNLQYRLKEAREKLDEIKDRKEDK